MSRQKDIDIYDIVDWLWSFRLLALVFIVLGLCCSAYFWTKSETPQRAQEITVTIFPHGNILQTEEQIAEIIVSKIADKDTYLLSQRAANPVVLSTTNESSEQNVRATVLQVERALFEQTRAWANEIAPLINVSTAAFDSYTKVSSFLDGAESGLIKLLTVESREMQSPVEWNRILLPLIAAAGLFLLIASITSIVKGWSKRRKLS